MSGAITLVLVFARVGSVVARLPVFQIVGIPRWVGALLGLALSAVIAATLPPAPLPPTVEALLFAMVTEIGVGTLLGIGVTTTFSAMSLGADIMAGQMGLSFATLFNPFDHAQESVLGTLSAWISGLLFISLNLHIRCIEILGASFVNIPAGALALPAGAAPTLVHTMSTTFATGVQLAGPVLALVWMLHLLVALLSKLAPRMNAFFSVGMSVTSVAGVAMFAVALPWIVAVHAGELQRAIDTFASGFTR